MRYSGKVTVDAGALHSGVRKLTDSLNETMRGFGVDQQVLVRTEIGSFSFESKAGMTWVQLEEIRKRAEAIMREKEPTWDFRVEQIIALY